MAPPPPPLIPQPNGRGALYAGGVPGNAGGGRPPDAFKALLASLASRARTIAALSKILKDKDHPHFMRALTFATEKGYPELEYAVRAALVQVNNTTNVNTTQVTHVWKIGDREVPY